MPTHLNAIDSLVQESKGGVPSQGRAPFLFILCLYHAFLTSYLHLVDESEDEDDIYDAPEAMCMDPTRKSIGKAGPLDPT